MIFTNTVIAINGSTEPLFTKESYQTIKKRIFDGALFIEVTHDGSKAIINKSVIGMCFENIEVVKNGKIKKSS